MHRGVLLLKRSHQTLSENTSHINDDVENHNNHKKTRVTLVRMVTSTLGKSVRAPVMKEHWIDCCIMSPRLKMRIIIIIAIHGHDNQFSLSFTSIPSNLILIGLHVLVNKYCSHRMFLLHTFHIPELCNNLSFLILCNIILAIFISRGFPWFKNINNTFF